MEFPVTSVSASVLFDFLSNSSGLQEWFSDKADEKENVFNFTWDGNSEQAVMIAKEQDKFIRLHWLHAPKEEYFEFRIDRLPGNNHLNLVITDFADAKNLSDQRQLWEYQVKDLMHRLGNK